MVTNTHKQDKNLSLNSIIIGSTTSLEGLIDAIFKHCEKEIHNDYLLLTKTYDVENLHQIRIHLRQFKSFLNFFKSEIADKKWSKANYIYKCLIKPTSTARDFDVIVTEYISPAFRTNKNDNEFQSLYQFSKSEQIKVHISIEKELTSIEYKNNLNDLQSWIKNKNWKNNICNDYNLKNEALRKKIDKKIQHKYKKIVQAKNLIASYNRKELHRLRVNIKELRYVLEILGAYTKHGKQERKLLKYLQNILGKINDTYTTEKIIQKMCTTGHDNISRSYIKQQAHHRRKKYLIQLKNFT